MCDGCKARVQKVKKCATCLSASYCSKEWQRRDWKEGGHKARCKFMTTRGGICGMVLACMDEAPAAERP